MTNSSISTVDAHNNRGAGRWRGAAIVTLLSVTALPLVWASSDTPVGAAPAQTEVTLTSITPVSVREDKVLRINGRVSSDTQIRDVIVQLELGATRFVSRSEVAEAAATPRLTEPVTDASDEIARIRADGSRTFRIAVPGDELQLFTSGVYPMHVTVTADGSSTVLTQANTFLPWVSENDPIPPSRLLFFWPLIDIPRRDAAGDTVVPGLRAELSDRGRLTTLSAAGADAPVTWVLDPLLLADVAALAGANPQDWLSDLPADIGDADVALVPFGDPDIAAAAVASAGEIIRDADERGAGIASGILGTDFRTDLGWPADGAADDTTIQFARRTGDEMLLVDATTAPLISALSFTPSGRAQVQDPDMELLLADRAASALVASPAQSRNDIVLSRQRFLAETLLHAGELPTDPRLLVLTPPRRWDPDPQWAQALVEATEQANWLEPVSLDQAITPGPPPFIREEPEIPEAAAERQLPAELVIKASSQLSNARKFRAILFKPGVLAEPIEDALYSSISTAWRADHELANTSLDATVERLTTQRSKVRIVSQGGTLSDDSGLLPVTIRNQLDQSVRVRLAVESDDPLRLRATAPDQRIRIGPQDLESIPVELNAVTSGRGSINAQLLTPRGRTYSDAVTLEVDVRGYGRVALLVFGAAAGLMVIAAVVRITRRIKRSRKPA